MNSARHKSLVEGLSGSAKKVYSTIPIQANISRPQIFDEIRRLNVSMSRHEVERCLYILMDCGLVTQPKIGQYRRVYKGEADVELQEATVVDTVEIKALAEELPKLEGPVAETAGQEIKGNENAMKNVTPMHKEKTTHSLSDADLATAILGVSIRLAETVGTMKQLAEEIEGLALEVEARLRQSGEAAEKLKVLRGLLQSVAA